MLQALRTEQHDGFGPQVDLNTLIENPFRQRGAISSIDEENPEFHSLWPNYYFDSGLAIPINLTESREAMRLRPTRTCLGGDLLA